MPLRLSSQINFQLIDNLAAREIVCGARGKTSFTGHCQGVMLIFSDTLLTSNLPEQKTQNANTHFLIVSRPLSSLHSNRLLNIQ